MPRPKGSPNKITAEIKERLSQVIMDAMSSIDIDSMTQNESSGTRNITKRIAFLIIPNATIYLKYLLFLNSSNSFFIN